MSKIKVVGGYTQKVQYGDNVEYREFKPDSVGSPFDDGGNTTILSSGAFSVTANIDPRVSKTFDGGLYGDYHYGYDSSNEVNSDGVQIYRPQQNLDPKNLSSYALFGSLREFIRVNLEDIITKWPASIYITPLYVSDGRTVSRDSVTDYVYDPVTEIASFAFPDGNVVNNFGVIYGSDGLYTDIDSDRNLTYNYDQYSLLFNGIEYRLVGFTASTNGYTSISVSGNPFTADTQYRSFYHIKPNSSKVDSFFKKLNRFQSYILNRTSEPKYSFVFNSERLSDDGTVLLSVEKYTWPVSDGYNIDFESGEYEDFASKLLDLSDGYDLSAGNLMRRALVTDSITEFDTRRVINDDVDSEKSLKMDKTLQIYGLSFDEINQLTENFKFLRSVSYDGVENTFDGYLPLLLNDMGWDFNSGSMTEDLQTIRNLIVNTPWMWKSKGTRKAVEFVMSFMGIPKEFVTYNEYVYVVKKPVDMEMFGRLLEYFDLDTDLSKYAVDSDGYPKIRRNTPELYYQSKGGWYEETGGSGSTIEKVGANDPHIGEYDGGYTYIDQFINLIPSFSSVTLTSSTVTTQEFELFSNYNSGTFERHIGTVTDANVYPVDQNGADISDYVIFTPEIIPTPTPFVKTNKCGCSQKTTGKALSLCVDGQSAQTGGCDGYFDLKTDNNQDTGLITFNLYVRDINGNVATDSNGNPLVYQDGFAPQECCRRAGGVPYLYNQSVDGQFVTSGYICCNDTGRCGCSVACDWMVLPDPVKLPAGSPTQNSFLQFVKPDGYKSVVTIDGCNCIDTLTVKVPNVTDPYTGEVGYGCMLTKDGSDDLSSWTAGSIYTLYKNRSKGMVPCY